MGYAIISIAICQGINTFCFVLLTILGVGLICKKMSEEEEELKEIDPKIQATMYS